MKSWVVNSMAAAVALSFGTPAAAQAPTDVKCLMASNLFSKAAKDPKARTVAEVKGIPFVGVLYAPTLVRSSRHPPMVVRWQTAPRTVSARKAPCRASRQRTTPAARTR